MTAELINIYTNTIIGSQSAVRYVGCWTYKSLQLHSGDSLHDFFPATSCIYFTSFYCFRQSVHSKFEMIFGSVSWPSLSDT